MKLSVIFSIFVLTASGVASAGALCPPDSCNPANGCMDGCAEQQLLCSERSAPDCFEHAIHSRCELTVQGASGFGTCIPVSPELPAACVCR